jgi:hypothetical protein
MRLILIIVPSVNLIPYAISSNPLVVMFSVRAKIN